MPQPITTVMNVEVSSVCDNKCEYCPSPQQHLHRKIGLMSMDTFLRAMDHVAYFVRQGTQTELNLFGVGEPTLNPLLPEMIKIARGVLPSSIPVHTNTNGNMMTEELALELKSAGVDHVDITGHKARSLANTVRIFKKVGLQGVISIDFAIQPNNWAGQVDWFEPDYFKAPHMMCPWLNKGQSMIMSDGRITTCCIDAFAKGVIGTVDDYPSTLVTRSHKLCQKCHHIVPAHCAADDLLMGGTDYGKASVRMQPAEGWV